MVNGEYRDYVNLDGIEVDTRGQASVAFAFTGFSHSDATSGKWSYVVKTLKNQRLRHFDLSRLLLTIKILNKKLGTVIQYTNQIQ